MHYQWAPKVSYRIEQIVGVIDKLLNRFNLFTEKSFAIYVLDDYSVHLMPQVPQALFKKGYVLVVIGGGITGNIQINDGSSRFEKTSSRFKDEIDAGATGRRSN